MTGALVKMVEGCRLILFDFDGPLCDVFAGLSAPDVARRLERLTDTQLATDDPLEVLRSIFRDNPALGAVVEDALVQAEIEAVRVARPEVAGVRAMRKFATLGRLIGIVSNNSADSIELFIRNHGLSDSVHAVVGRAFRRPDLMKPHPWPIREALRVLGCSPDQALLIGDSATDIEAAQRAGTNCIAFANRPSKVASFSGYGVPIVTTMAEVAAIAASVHAWH